MQAKSAAFVVHRTTHRVRIKIPAHQGQQAYFSAVQLHLAVRPDVIAVKINPQLGSVVIHYRAGFDLAVIQQIPGVALALVEAPAGSAARKFAPDGVYGFSEESLAFARSVFKLAMAIATRQLGAHLMDWLIDVAVGAVLAQFIEPPLHSPQVAPRRILRLQAAE